jgi:phosphoglycerate kinase
MVEPSMSLKPIAAPLSAVLGVPVAFAEDCVGPVAAEAVGKMRDGDVLLLENVRFHPGEEQNDHDMAMKLASNGDLYVNDAFSAAHRAHASTEGLAHRLPAYAGEQMRRELDALDAALGNPQRPVLGIVGGAKVSTKLDLLNNLVEKLDYLAIGGGMANTFRFAEGYDIGGSLCEKEMADTARAILEKAKTKGCRLILPTDVVVARELKPDAMARVTQLDAEGHGVAADEKIFDVGPNTLKQVVDAMAQSKTLIWNGPLGVFEVQPFDHATVEAAQEAARLAKAGKLVAVAGGGDTVAALNAAGVAEDFTFVSTAGGAFLEWMEGKTLPGVAALSQ